MLLPAFPCDASQTATMRRISPRLASPPASPTSGSSPTNAFGNLISTCMSLQSMLSSAPITTDENQPMLFSTLPSPPMSNAPPPTSLYKVRVRPARKSSEAPNNTDNPIAQRKKVIRRAPLRMINTNKRLRADDNDDACASGNESAGECDDTLNKQPSTPKRARIAPEIIPRGLERADFHRVAADDEGRRASTDSNSSIGTHIQTETDGTDWSVEDDHVLLELLLEKMKISKEDWFECARTMGKDSGSLMVRWKSLVARGEVGLTGRGRGSRSRGKPNATW